MDTKELVERAKPLLELLKEKYNMHTSIIVSMDKIKIVTDEISCPIKVEEEKVFTCELVEELKKREAVQCIEADLDKEIKVIVGDKEQVLQINKGPAIVLVVWD